MDRVSELRRIRVFADLREAELQWLADHAEFRDLEAGEAAVVEGTPASYMLAVIDGELRGRREKAAFDGVVIVVRAGDVSGMLPFSRMQTFPVTSRAMVPTRLAIFPASLFPEMLERVPVLEPRL
ncbi:MAG TPA: cyclic nucleotide-binding domain-containing protein, partial [Longimicrobiales bacterium]|nr:cyclic nucleotide-binding domain-containing protein [Longimicrobiales bacterium]